MFICKFYLLFIYIVNMFEYRDVSNVMKDVCATPARGIACRKVVAKDSAVNISLMVVRSSRSLSNPRAFSSVFSAACVTAKFDEHDSFSLRFVISFNHASNVALHHRYRYNCLTFTSQLLEMSPLLSFFFLHASSTLLLTERISLQLAFIHKTCGQRNTKYETRKKN